MGSRALAEKFARPENWDKCSEGAGWIMYCGGNDWENSATAAWVVFPSDEENRRIWFKIKFPNGCVVDSGKSGGGKDETARECTKHAEKARRAWARVATMLHRNRNHGSRSWKDAFRAALLHKDMKPFVAEHGEERTLWKDMNESRARSVVGVLLEEPEDVDAGEFMDYFERSTPRTFSLRSPISPAEPMTAPCWIVLHQSHASRPDFREWVTHMQNMENQGMNYGHYFTDYAEAVADYNRRCADLRVDPAQSERFDED